RTMNLIMHFNPPHEDWFARVPNFRRNPNAKGVSHVHVNIVDIIDCWEADERPQLFKSRKELSNYVKTGMRFPLDIIRQDKVLRVFLGHVD
ncbi:hypothetical protein N7450_007539, partial [Penicillium hetheringtonii]